MPPFVRIVVNLALIALGIFALHWLESSVTAQLSDRFTLLINNAIGFTR